MCSAITLKDRRPRILIGMNSDGFQWRRHILFCDKAMSVLSVTVYGQGDDNGKGDDPPKQARLTTPTTWLKLSASKTNDPIWKQQIGCSFLSVLVGFYLERE